MPGISNPTTAAIQANANLRATGTRRVGQGEATGDLWELGLVDEELYQLLMFKSRTKGRYFMQLMMQFFGARAVPTKQLVYQWREMQDIKEGDTLTVVGTTGSATITYDTARDKIYRLVNDVMNLNNGIQAIVTAVTLAGAGTKEQVTVAKINGGNWGAGELNVTDVLGYSHNAWAEGSGQPDSRQWGPETFNNRLQQVKTTAKQTGDAMTEKTDIVVDGVTFWSEAERWFSFEEHCRKVEGALMNAVRSDDAANPQTEGFLRTAERLSPEHEYVSATGPDESDLQDAALLLHTLDDMDEHMGCLGKELFYGMTRHSNIRDYFVNGGVDYGAFGERKKLAIGIGVKTYVYGDKVLHLKEYKGFNDVQTMGQSSAGVSATVTDYQDFGLFLNMGYAQGYSGQLDMPLLHYRYKSANGINRSLIAGIEPGMTGSQGTVGNGVDHTGVAGGNIGTAAGVKVVAHGGDYDSFYLSSQIGAQMVQADSKHFIMRATS